MDPSFGGVGVFTLGDFWPQLQGAADALHESNALKGHVVNWNSLVNRDLYNGLL